MAGSATGTNARLSDRDFAQNLNFGQIAESTIAKYIMRKWGATILPVYDTEKDEGKGPRVFSAKRQLAAPDLFVFSTKGTRWAEVKHKTRFSWYGIGGYWVTGIDLHHYRQYQEVESRLGVPVYLLFLHIESSVFAGDRKWGCPEQCPTGLYSGKLSTLTQCESHRSKNHGRHGMVYWRETSLAKLATIEEVNRVVA